MQVLNLTAPIIQSMSEFKDWQAPKNCGLSDWLIGPFNFSWSLIGLCMKSKQWRVCEGSPRRPLFPIQYEMQLLCLTFYSQSATLDHPTHLISFLNKVLPWNGEIEGKVREAALCERNEVMNEIDLDICTAKVLWTIIGVEIPHSWHTFNIRPVILLEYWGLFPHLSFRTDEFNSSGLLKCRLWKNSASFCFELNSFGHIDSTDHS